MTKPTIARILDNDNFGLEGPSIRKRPFLDDMVALLTPTLDRGLVFQELIQFTAAKTIVGAPEGAVFNTPLVEANTREVWQYAWASHSEGALGRNFFLDLIIRPGAGQTVAKISVFGGASPRPLLGSNKDEGIDDWNLINPLIVLPGQQISINSPVLMAIGTVITVSAVGYRVQGAVELPQEIGSQIAIL